MVLSKAKIKYFRTIDSIEVDIQDNYLSLVGENNVGKSNILIALDIFFNPDNYEKTDVIKKCVPNIRSVSKSEISLIFSNLTKEELLKFRTYIKGPREAKSLEITARITKSTPKIIYWSPVTGANIREDAVKNLLERFIFKLIPATRDPQNYLAIGESALIKDLILSWTAAFIKKPKGGLFRKFESGLSDLENKVLAPLTEKINKDLSISNPNINYKLKAKKFDLEILHSFLEIIFEERGAERAIQELGTGLQNNLIIVLFKILTRTDKRHVILAYEEPEAHLHPHAQRQFLQALSNELSTEGGQAIISTHSPYMINMYDITNIVHVSKSESRFTSTNTFITTVSQVSKDFLSKNKIDCKKNRTGV